MNISLNFVVKLSFGLTKILIGWLRISPKDSGILSENGTAGTGFEGFELRISSIGKPPTSFQQTNLWGWVKQFANVDREQ